MNRVVAFIDGFNMYHSINGILNQYKWLDYIALSQAFLAKSKEHLDVVIYFSAYSVWNDEKTKRHKNYVRALEHAGVDVVLGKFKKVTRKCRECRKIYQTFEEKETDVNIATYMLKLAVLDKFDMAMLFTGDSDLIPCIKAIREVTPHKHIKLIVPYGRSAEDLKKHCDSSARIKKHHLARNQFPDPIIVDKARGIYFAKPPSWNEIQPCRVISTPQKP